MSMQVGSGGGEDAPMTEMNMTPLIDVMLVLLIMFIITIPIQTHAVKMNMPIPSHAQPKEPRPPIRIDVDFDGTLGWNGVAVTAGELQSKLAEVAREPDQQEVHLRPNKLVTYKHVAMVMANAQRLGVVKIGLVGNEQFLN
ncbi:MAG: biopolymer transporter ExbD [Burkholderiaceae bacterium]|nr:biopolymer transporter ExbD [Burkholderiaceae bacterium]